MKRRILLIFMMLLFTLHAAQVGNAVTVTLVLTLQRDPQYYMGITSERISKKEDITTSAVNSVDLKEENYYMVCNDDLYLSYYFQEFNRVKITAQLSGDLCWTDKTESWETTEKIPYFITLYNSNNELLKTLASSNTDEVEVFNTESLNDTSNVIAGEAQTIGYEKHESYKMTITSNYDLANNNVKLGSYKSSVTFKVVSY